jgi:Protein of unknown function (DUF2971)
MNERPQALQKAIDEYDRWSDQQALSEQTRNSIETPLYHYTDGRGLKGIIEGEAMWFTDYRHMNDPSELTHGIEAVRDVIRAIEPGVDGRVGLWLATLADMFSQQNFSNALEFFIGSFSRERDDLGQWRSYADNGRGYALGLAPKFFRVVETPNRKPNENVFVAPVVYRTDKIWVRHQGPIEKAASIFLETVEANAALMQNKNEVGIPFLQDMARAVIASPLIWNCLTSKHPAYEHEREVRLIVLGLCDKLMPYIKTRLRGSEIVPYIEHRMALREPHSIVEIVVGPAAPVDTERTVRTMLKSLGADPNLPVGRSDIPYRAL